MEILFDAPVAETGAELFLLKLKHATKSAHQQLEATAISRRLMSYDVTLNDYSAYLQAMVPVIRFTEACVFDEAGAVVADLHRRIKLPLLLNDLAAVGVPTSIVLQSYPAAWHQILPGIGAALAWMYVIEGSTLGGKFISRHLQQVLGSNAGISRLFLNCYGADTGNLWKAFLLPFSKTVIATETEDDVIEQANKVFEKLRTHFESCIT